MGCRMKSKVEILEGMETFYDVLNNDDSEYIIYGGVEMPRLSAVAIIMGG